MGKSKAILAVGQTSTRAPLLRRVPARVVGKPDCYLGRLNAPIVQPALKVGAADDPLEKEAEMTASKVASMPAPEIVPPPEPSSKGRAELVALPMVQRKGMDDQPNTDALEVVPPVPADHQDPEVPKEEDVDATSLTADDMKEIESGEPEDTAGDTTAEASAPPDEDEEVAQPARPADRAVIGAEGGPAPPDIAAKVRQPGNGRSIPLSVRAFMEPRFGKDFSDVRIHDCFEDRRTTQRIGARAFTHRRHIWLGPGETIEDRRLIAHELAHVVQQTRPRPAPMLERQVDLTEDRGEPELRRGYIRDKAEKYAQYVPGYRLVSVILGKSPITGERVERNATNLLGALMAMIPGGGLLFDRLMETRVIQDAFEWVQGRLHSLNITWARIKGLVDELIGSLSIRSLINIKSKAKSLFAPIVRDILTFIGEIKDKILEFIIRGALKLAGPLADRVWEVIQKAGSVISTILKDPLGFAKNLFAAVLGGFKQFGANVLKHIKKGLLGWLFGAVQGLDIEIPEKLDFKGLISIALQIVGLTYKNFRQKLVKRLGPNGEQKVAFLEKSVEVVKILVKEGFAGLWQRLLQMIDSFKQTVIDGIRKFVIQSLIMGGLSWLAGLTNPVGAVVKVVLAIYNIIKTFLERLEQILEVAKSIFSSIGAIAAGKIQQAADFIEKTIAATIPVVIFFLAALVPITGITNAIRSIIKKLRKPVDKAMDKMIGLIVKKAKKLFSKLIGKLNKKRKLPSVTFKVGKQQHRIFAEKKGNQVQVMVASKPIPIEQTEAETMAETKKLESPEAKKIGKAISNKVAESDDRTEKSEKKIKLDSKKQNQLKNLEGLQKEIDTAAKGIQASAKGAEENPEIDTHTEGKTSIFWATESRRDPKVEGEVGTYGEMRKIVEASIKKSGRSIYDVDHVIEKQIPKAILNNLGEIDPEKSDAEKQTKDAANFGRIGTGEYTKIGEKAPQLPGIILYHPNHVAKASLHHSRVKKWIEKASNDADPHGTLKKQLREQLTTECNKVADVYQKDAEATAPIRDNIKRGLEEIQKKNIDLYDLDKAEVTILDPTQKHPQAEFKTRDSSLEGQYGKHDSHKKAYSKKNLEADHIVEKSYPVKAKNLKFSMEPVQGLIKDAANNIDEKDVDLKTRNKRLKKLEAQKIYNKGDIGAYDGKTGHSMLIYYVIHRAVSKDSPGARKTEDLFDEEKKLEISPAARAYLQSGKEADLTRVRTVVKAGIQRKVNAATETHCRKVESKYDQEIKNLKAAKADGDSKAQKAQALAVDEMREVVKTVKRNLRKARTYSMELFS